MREAGGGVPMDQAEMNAILNGYAELMGHVNPRVRSRVERAAAAAPELLRRMEALRTEVTSAGPFDGKTVELMIFGMLLTSGDDAAKSHAWAARRAGASWEELHAVVGLALLCRGLTAFDLAGEAWEYIAAQEAANGTLAVHPNRNGKAR